MRSPDDVVPLHLLDVVAFGREVPVYAWLVRGASGGVLVDTGMVDSTPALDEEWQPTLHPWPELPNVHALINTHLHFDHCGGNRRFAGVPTYVQRAELAAASGPDYVEEWVRFEGATYVELDGDAEVVPGISVLSTPGHSAGHQAVIVETSEGPVVLGGDVTYSMDELIRGDGPNFRRIRDLQPRRVYLAHAARPWEPGLR